MKKKLALFLSILSCVMMLGACGAGDPTKVDYNGYTYQQLYDHSVSLGTTLKDATEKSLQEELVYLEYLQNNPSQNTSGIDVGFYFDLTQKWMEAMKVSGNYSNVKDNSFTITKSGKTLTTDLILVFENREVVFQLVYNYHNMQLTGVTINPVYSFGEKMQKAGMNTLISISIVFTVLIIISLLIAGFQIFPYMEAQKKEKEAQLKAAEEPKDDLVAQIEQREEQFGEEEELVDDTELVAVIAAAIAAYEGTSADGFVVRSIRRR